MTDDTITVDEFCDYQDIDRPYHTYHIISIFVTLLSSQPSERYLVRTKY